MDNQTFSKVVLDRIPLYLKILRRLQRENVETTSSVKIANLLNLGEVLVRKDLALISGKGKPKIGYYVDDLLKKVEKVLYGDKITNAIIVGAGKLGKAYFHFDGFKDYGLKVVACFDKDKNVIDEKQNIFDISSLKNFCQNKDIKLGILTVPEHFAQEVCDIMVESGITAILNCAPIRLNVPDNVSVRNENVASSLSTLARTIN